MYTLKRDCTCYVKWVLYCLFIFKVSGINRKKGYTQIFSVIKFIQFYLYKYTHKNICCEKCVCRMMECTMFMGLMH